MTTATWRISWSSGLIYYAVFVTLGSTHANTRHGAHAGVKPRHEDVKTSSTFIL